jgi:ribonuclease P protein component
MKSTAQPTELSTSTVHKCAEAVDDSPAGHWLGAVLPKRLAKRSVTRNLLRRQIRAALGRHQASLPPGLWVVRLRAGFARSDFVSAASDALRRAARAELDQALLRRRPAAGR